MEARGLDKALPKELGASERSAAFLYKVGCSLSNDFERVSGGDGLKKSSQNLKYCSMVPSLLKVYTYLKFCPSEYFEIKQPFFAEAVFRFCNALKAVGELQLMKILSGSFWAC